MERYLQTALFDLDGTLIDTEGQHTRFWAQVGEELIPNGKVFAQMIKGRTLKSIFADFIPNPDIQEEVRRRLNCFEREMDYPIISGAMEFLTDLRRYGVHTAVVTSSNEEKMRNVRSKVPQLLALCDRVFTAEDFTASKPAPDCYLLGAKTFGTPLNRCIVLEDAPNGLEAGMSAGIMTIALATGYPQEALRGMCHHIEKDFTNLNYERANALLYTHNAR